MQQFLLFIRGNRNDRQQIYHDTTECELIRNPSAIVSNDGRGFCELLFFHCKLSLFILDKNRQTRL